MKKQLSIFSLALGMLVACGFAAADQRDDRDGPETAGLETFPLGGDKTAVETSSPGIMRVSYLEPGLERVAGPFPRAMATIRVVDGDGRPVQGATVFGKFSGDVGRRPPTLKGVTDANGAVTLKTKQLGSAQPVFSFELLDITHPDLEYDPDAQ